MKTRFGSEQILSYELCIKCFIFVDICTVTMALYLRRVDNIVAGAGNILIVAIGSIVALIHRRDIDSKSHLYT